MKKILIFAFILIFLAGLVSAVDISSNSIYLEVNKTYPLILVPLDENIWDITLNVQESSGNWTSFNFTWTGSQYELNILFIDVGNFPFVVNSSEVNGSIEGIFLVRETYNITFRFYKSKSSHIFFSNKYINEMAFVTAELTGNQTFTTNAYNSFLEPFIAQISSERFNKPVWHGEYNNGVATIKLYEIGEHAIRLIDGEIIFASEYAVPNITKSYGIDAYIGKFNYNGTSTTQSLYLSSKDLHSYRWLSNITLIILLVIVLGISVVLFFMMHEHPSFPLIFGFLMVFLLLVVRGVIWIWTGN